MWNKALRGGDFILIALVLLLAAAVAAPYLLAPSRTLYCEVQQDGALVRRVRLADGYRDSFWIAGGANLVEIDGRRVRIQQAGCTDQVCVRTGWLTRAGQAAVCLPNRVIVRLTGAAENDGVDAIVQ